MKREHSNKSLNLLVPIFILLILSLLNMYGASFISILYKNNLVKQIIWITIGLLVMFITYKTDIKILLKYSKYFYILGLLSLILVLFFGSNINGATSWFKIGPVSFQPSELFKFFYILYLASVISNSNDSSFKLLIKIIFLTFLPCILIFLEPDTGVVLMYLLMMLGFLLESPIKKSHILFITSLACIFIGSFLYLYFYESELFISIFGTSFFYRMDRLIGFKNSTSYQLKNALIGIGSSGIKGLGLKSKKIYIPEVTTDFVFDLTILNFGYVIGIAVVFLYTYILFILYKEIDRTKKREDKLILSSIFYMMLFQVCEHIMMNLGLTPITGITLPFLSYGGSSLLSYFMLFGLILKITTNSSSYNRIRHRHKV